MILLFSMQTVSWLMFVATLAAAFLLFYFRMWLTKVWGLGVERFFRKLKTDEEFLEGWIEKSKNVIKPLTGSIFFTFAFLFILMGIANIIAVERSGGLLLSFSQFLWLMFAPFQMVFWAIAENAVYGMSLIGMTKDVTPNPAWLIVAYAAVYSVATIGAFWFVFPYEDKLKIYPEEGDEETIASNRKKNKFARNFFRSLLMIAVFAYILVNSIFDRTMVPMWDNPGVQRVVEIFSYYSDQAMVIEADPATTAVSPITYGYENTAAQGGLSLWIWILIIVAILAAVFALYWFVLRGKLSGGKSVSIMDPDKVDVSSNDLDGPYNRLKGAKGSYYNFVHDAVILHQALTQGKVAEAFVNDVNEVLKRVPDLVASLYEKLTGAKKVYDGFHEDFQLVDYVLQAKLDKDGKFNNLIEITRVRFINASFAAIQKPAKYTGSEMDIQFLKYALKQQDWVGDMMRKQVTEAVKQAEQRFA